MKINVSHIAKLANLPLTDKEKKKFEEQLESTLQYIEQLNDVKTKKNINQTSNVTGLKNVLRKDTEESSLSQKEALTNAQQTKNGLFQVKGIFEEK